jgi:hypothetical protein
LKHKHFYVWDSCKLVSLALERLLPPSSFHHSSNSSLCYYCYYFDWPSISNSREPIMHAHHAESFAFGSNNWANPLSKPSLKYIDMKEQMWRLSGTNSWVCTYCLLKQSQIEQLHTLDNYSLTSSTQQFGKGPKL